METVGSTPTHTFNLFIGNIMERKEVIVTVRGDKGKGEVKHELTVMEPESPVTIEYAINCSATNYSNSVMDEISKRGIPLDKVISVKYKNEEIEKYAPNQGKEIKNRL